MKTPRVSVLLGVLLLLHPIARAQNFAPASLANMIFNGAISNGTYPYASSGTAAEVFSADGSFFILGTSPSVGSSSGTYVYLLTGQNSGSIVETFSGAVLPVTTYSFTFTSAIGGSFTAFANGVEVQSGTFALSPFSLAAPLVNISTRGFVGTGSNVLIAGFVIGGTVPRSVLIRASGPALEGFGVAGVLPDPKLVLNSGSTAVASNIGWGGSAAIASAASSVGAFAWTNLSSADSALVVTLSPGAYSAVVSGASGDTGAALVEVYYIP